MEKTWPNDLRTWYEENRDNIPHAIEALEKEYDPTQDSLSFRVLATIERLAETSHGVLGVKVQTKESAKYYPNIVGSLITIDGLSADSGLPVIRIVPEGVAKPFRTIKVTWLDVEKTWLELPALELPI